MGTRKAPTFGAVDRIYGVLRANPYRPMNIRAISRGVGPDLSRHTVVGNAAHCRNRFHPYVRRVGPGIYMYTPGGALDDARYPEQHTRTPAKRDPRSPMGKRNDALRAELDAELTRKMLADTEPDPAPAVVRPVVPNHVERVTYAVLGELKDGGVLLVDNEGDVWEIKRLIARSPR